MDLRGPVRVERLGDFQSSLIVRRELAHVAARIVPIVFGEEALVADVRGIDTGLEEQPRPDGRGIAHARLIDGAPDLRLALRRVHYFRAGAVGERKVKSNRLGLERDV